MNSVPASLWTPDDVAAYLGKPVSWVYENWRGLRIPAFKIGQHLRFDPTEVHAWVREQRAA